MTNRSLLLITGLAFMLCSCERNDYIEPAVETPVFTISGYRNGEPFTISAGENGLIQTGTIERNKFGVMEWTSSFTSASCLTCEPEFSLTINDREGVDLSDCTNLEIFANNQIQFAQEVSASDYEECTLSIEGVEESEDVSFSVPGTTTIGSNNFSFDTEGVYQVTAEIELEIEGSLEENDIQIHQTIFAGAHQRISAPFLYEVLENEDDEQEIRLLFPEIPGLRPTGWDINGVIDDQESITREFQTDTENRIEIFYVNDATGIEGSYSIEFNRGFPINDACDEDHHIMPAPSINVDWAAGEPNYERAFITYRWQGKTFVSASPLNSNSVLKMLSSEPYAEGLQGKNALQLNTTFSVTLVELGNESNVIELTDCAATFGFVIPQ